MTLEEGLRAMIAEIVRAEVTRALTDATRADEYLSTGAAAKLADVAPGTIRRWIREGRLPEHRAGRVVRVLRADLERLLRDGVRAGPSLSPEEQARRDFR